MTITCQVCGTANPDGTTYCEGCGVELTAQSATQSDTAVAETPASPSPANASEAAPVSTPVETPPLEPVSTNEPVVTEAATNAAPVPEASATETPAAPTSTGEPVVADSATTPEAMAPAADAAPAPVSVPDSETPVGTAPVSAAPTETPAETTPVAVPATPVPIASTGEAKLGIKKFGAPTGDFIPLQGDHMVVGRFDASTGPVDIDLSGLGGQEHISRRHAELYRENGAWHVRDLGSTNGVYIKHKNESAFSPRLQEPAALSDGDEIAFGNLMMTFHQG